MSDIKNKIEEDPLERFVRAQSHSYERAFGEIKSGMKQSCWMWYIFPQIQGLGMSDTAIYYAIEDIAEAKAYMAHDTLGPRLIEISEALLSIPRSDPREVMGYIDAMKLHSSMTLFEIAAPTCDVFSKVLDKYYEGSRDSKTIEILDKQATGEQ